MMAYPNAPLPHKFLEDLSSKLAYSLMQKYFDEETIGGVSGEYIDDLRKKTIAKLAALISVRIDQL